MDNINILQSLWEQQPTVIQKNSNDIVIAAKKKVRKIKSNHIWTISMLSSLIIALLYLFFTYRSSQNFDQIKGLGLMIAVIICRVLLEIFSLVRFKNIKLTYNFEQYTEQLMAYYKFRKWMHFILTPAIYFLYIIGFVSLLPVFKQQFSEGFYWYILISGFSFLFLFSFVLYKVIKRDLGDLEYLKNIQLSN